MVVICLAKGKNPIYKNNKYEREYSHALLSLAELINRCNHGIELCGEQAVGSQFAESVRDPALRRELKKNIRQDPTI